jgi:hypothetical protein
MSGPALKPRVARLENGRWRPEIVIAHESGDQSVWGASSVATHNEALARAQRLIATASAAEPVTFEVVPRPGDRHRRRRRARAGRRLSAPLFRGGMRKFRFAPYMCEMSPWELNRSHKAGRRSGRTVASQPSLFREPLVRQDSPKLRSRIMKARRRFELYHRSKDMRFE